MPKRHNFNNVAMFMDYDIDFERRTIYLGSDCGPKDVNDGVDANFTEKVIKTLHILDSNAEQPINIIMNGYGGDAHYATGIYDYIKQCKSFITISVYGPVMSANTIILQAADKRLISPLSLFMMHYGTSSIDDNAINYKNWAKARDQLNKTMEEIYLSQIRKKHPTFTTSKIKKLLNFDTILSANETVSLGLADEVL